MGVGNLPGGGIRPLPLSTRLVVWFSLSEDSLGDIKALSLCAAGVLLRLISDKVRAGVADLDICRRAISHGHVKWNGRLGFRRWARGRLKTDGCSDAAQSVQQRKRQLG